MKQDELFKRLDELDVILNHLYAPSHIRISCEWSGMEEGDVVRLGPRSYIAIKLPDGISVEVGREVGSPVNFFIKDVDPFIKLYQESLPLFDQLGQLGNQLSNHVAFPDEVDMITIPDAVLRYAAIYSMMTSFDSEEGA